MEKKKNLHKKIYWVIFVLIGILLVCIFFGYNNKNTKINLNGHIINVEVANTQAEREVGLGNREDLCKNCGMLFVFEKLDKYSFWMKDMKFDIDIIWINNDRIIDISKNVLHNTPTHIIMPNIAVNRVLELNAGSVDKFDLEVGQKIINLQ
jgi:uncharacterized membrane protein (UPF0127 family)